MGIKELLERRLIGIAILFACTLLVACNSGDESSVDPEPPSVENYSIGGTLNDGDVLGNGLVLKLNGEQTVSIAPGDASFRFDDRIPDGSNFQISVDAPPRGPLQTCDVSPSSGTVSGQDITDIRVECSTRRFSVGGEISGLQGSGLVLEMSDGQTYEPESEGEFSFSTPILDQTDFTVSIAQQPQLPEQQCAISGNEGTIDEAHHSDVSIICTTNLYSISGEVHGLEPSDQDLVLALNDSALPAINGSEESGVIEFESDYGLPTGSSFSVTVEQAPGGPVQNCVVSNGEGVVGSDAHDNVRVDCQVQTFSVGGSVVGLDGEGFQLSLNGGQQLDIPAGSGDFTFDQPIPDRSEINVSVSNAPASPSQVCIVDQGNGDVIDGEDYNDLLISCETEKFTVGGQVTGLEGEYVGLRLSSNNLGSSQTKDITSNGEFVFDQHPLDDQSSFTVVVPSTEHPVSPKQHCSVHGGNGQLDGEDYRGIVVSCVTETYTVSTTVDSGSGSVNPSQKEVDHGQTATLGIVPDTGYEISSISGCSGSLSGGQYTTGTITSDCMVNVDFSIKRYTITASASSGGSISPSSRTVIHGNTTSFSVSIQDDYSPSNSGSWGCNGTLSGSGSNRTYTTGSVTGNCSINATFSFDFDDPDPCPGPGDCSIQGFSGELLVIDWDKSDGVNDGGHIYRVESIADRSGDDALEKVVEGRPPLRIEGFSPGGDLVRISRVRSDEERDDMLDPDGRVPERGDGSESLESVEKETIVVEKPPVTHVPDVPYQESVDASCVAEMLPQPWFHAAMLGGQDMRVSSDGASAIWLSRAEGDWVRLAWSEEDEVWSEEWRASVSADIQVFEVDAFHRRAYALDSSGGLRMFNLIEATSDQDVSDEEVDEQVLAESPMPGEVMGDTLTQETAVDFVVDPAGHWIAVLDSDRGIQMYRWDPWSGDHEYVRTDSYAGDWMALKPGGEVLYLGTTSGKDSAESFLYAFAVNPEDLELRLLGAEKVDYPQGKPTFSPDGKYMIDDSGKQQWLLPIDEDSRMPIHGSVYWICSGDDGSTENAVD